MFDFSWASSAWSGGLILVLLGVNPKKSKYAQMVCLQRSLLLDYCFLYLLDECYRHPAVRPPSLYRLSEIAKSLKLDLTDEEISQYRGKILRYNKSRHYVHPYHRQNSFTCPSPTVSLVMPSILAHWNFIQHPLLSFLFFIADIFCKHSFLYQMLLLDFLEIIKHCTIYQNPNFQSNIHELQATGHLQRKIRSMHGEFRHRVLKVCVFRQR